MTKKRRSVLIQPPSAYAISPCSCGNADTQWSEFEQHLWCEVCKKDFIPAHNGIFDGPIPVMAAQMLGISFDLFNLETQTIEPFILDEPCTKSRP